MKGNLQQNGFTLIELMTVVAIIAILLSIAVPAYQGYVVRSKVTNGMMAAAPAKVAVSEYYASRGELPPGGDNAAAGFSSTYNSPYIESVDWHDEQRIEIEFDEVALGINSQLELGLAPEIAGDFIVWRCAQDMNVSDENLRFLPASCRNRL